MQDCLPSAIRDAGFLVLCTELPQKAGSDSLPVASLPGKASQCRLGMVSTLVDIASRFLHLPVLSALVKAVVKVLSEFQGCAAQLKSHLENSCTPAPQPHLLLSATSGRWASKSTCQEFSYGGACTQLGAAAAHDCPWLHRSCAHSLSATSNGTARSRSSCGLISPW